MEPETTVIAGPNGILLEAVRYEDGSMLLDVPAELGEFVHHILRQLPINGVTFSIDECKIKISNMEALDKFHRYMKIAAYHLGD